MLKTIKQHPFAFLLYFLQFALILIPISNQKFVIWLFIFVNIHAFILINFLTIAYNRINNKNFRSLTFQIKIGLIVILFFVIYNYFNLFFGGPSYALSSKSVIVVIFQNTLTFLLWNPFSIFLTMTLSMLADGSLWTPDKTLK